jgi:predicted DNA-binding transcriptional regulator YafY
MIIAMDPIETIVEAARRRQTVIITAREKDGSVGTREVEPYSLRSKGEGALFFAWCLTRNRIRSWYLNNVLTAEVTGKVYAPRFPVEF